MVTRALVIKRVNTNYLDNLRSANINYIILIRPT